jgi:hypothetical protein
MRFPRRHVAAVLLAALVAALPAWPALAQSGPSDSGGVPDLLPVVLWTVVAAVIGLSAVGVGYLYRRQKGIDKPLRMPPIPADALAVQLGDDPLRGAAGQPLSPHEVVEHAAAGHDDETDQAALLHERH